MHTVGCQIIRIVGKENIFCEIPTIDYKTTKNKIINLFFKCNMFTFLLNKKNWFQILMSFRRNYKSQYTIKKVFYIF